MHATLELHSQFDSPDFVDDRARTDNFANTRQVRENTRDKAAGFLFAALADSQTGESLSHIKAAGLELQRLRNSQFTI